MFPKISSKKQLNTIVIIEVMTMIIVLFILHFLTFKMFLCLQDEFTLNSFDFTVRKPLLSDLSSNDNQQKYCDEVISKYNEYEFVKKELEKANVVSTPILAFLPLQALSFVLLYSFLPDSELINKIYIKIILIVVISLIGSLIVYFHHKRSTRVKPFDFEKSKNEFDLWYAPSFELINNDYHFNNFIMIKHLDYLKSIKSTIIYNANTYKYSILLLIFYVILLVY